MLNVLAHSDLPHQFIFVSVHASQLTNMSKNVLQAVSKLEITSKNLINLSNHFIYLIAYLFPKLAVQ